MRKMVLHTALITLFVLVATGQQKVWAESQAFKIYNIAHEIALTRNQKNLKKNFYISVGEQEGIAKGTFLDVMRVISMTDPYDGKKRVNYKTRIAKLKVLHAGPKASIAVLAKIYNGENDPYFDVPAPMIGDLIEVSLKN